MTLLTALIIATNDPAGMIVIDAFQTNAVEKWTAFLWLKKESGSLRSLLELCSDQDHPDGFSTEKDAVDAMAVVKQQAIDFITNKSYDNESGCNGNKNI